MFYTVCNMFNGHAQELVDWAQLHLGRCAWKTPQGKAKQSKKGFRFEKKLKGIANEFANGAINQGYCPDEWKPFWA